MPHPCFYVYTLWTWLAVSGNEVQVCRSALIIVGPQRLSPVCPPAIRTVYQCCCLWIVYGHPEGVRRRSQEAKEARWSAVFGHPWRWLAAGLEMNPEDLQNQSSKRRAQPPTLKYSNTSSLSSLDGTTEQWKPSRLPFSRFSRGLFVYPTSSSSRSTTF